MLHHLYTGWRKQVACCCVCVTGRTARAEESVFKVRLVGFQGGRYNMTIGPCNRQDYAVAVPQKASRVLAGPRCSAQEH